MSQTSAGGGRGPQPNGPGTGTGKPGRRGGQGDTPTVSVAANAPPGYNLQRFHHVRRARRRRGPAACGAAAAAPVSRPLVSAPAGGARRRAGTTSPASQLAAGGRSAAVASPGLVLARASRHSGKPPRARAATSRWARLPVMTARKKQMQISRSSTGCSARAKALPSAHRVLAGLLGVAGCRYMAATCFASLYGARGRTPRAIAMVAQAPRGLTCANARQSTCARPAW